MQHAKFSSTRSRPRPPHRPGSACSPSSRYPRRLPHVPRLFRCTLLATFRTHSAVCLSYTGRGGRVENPKPESSPEFAPMVLQGSTEEIDCPRPGMTRDDLSTRAEEGDADGERGKRQISSCSSRGSPCGRPSVSARLAPADAAIPTETNVCDVVEGVFGGALDSFQVSPVQNPLLAAAASGKVQGSGARPPPEKYFVAYGHCLLAGAGTGVYDEAAEAAAAAGHLCGAMGQQRGGDFGGASGRARVSRKRRARRYGDALEVFQEGLRYFPTSTALLYGTSFTMQASMYVFVLKFLRQLCFSSP